MVQWFLENKGEIAVIAVLLALVILIVWNMLRSKKKGGGCSCGCSGCAFQEDCHKK
jgi:hypothetical protein